jgi:heme/copper-type cytochrome/quinol oxidase subunit 2
MTAISILPILIILFIVVIISSFTAKSMKRKVPNMGKSFSSNWVRRIFTGYISLLVICTIVVPFIIGKDINDFKKAPIVKVEKEGNALLDAAAKGKFATIESNLIEKKWNLAYHESKLNLTTETDQYFGAQIFVERKNTNDDKIEAVAYRTSSSMNDMDISKLINPIRLKVAGNLLTVQNPKQAKLKFSMFNNVFAVTQFTGEASSFQHNSSFYDGQSILYLRIPKDLELIIKSDLNIQFVE